GRRDLRHRQYRSRSLSTGRIGARLLRLFQAAAFDGDETRAKAGHAREVLVAGRLVDLALASQFRLQRLDRQAVRLFRAVAAAFAHGFVDHGALGRVGVLALFAAAALFGGAGLVVDHGRDARHLAQFLLHVHQFEAVAHGDAFGPRIIVRVFFGFVGDDDDRFHAFGSELAADPGRIQRTVVGLAAGHRY